VLKVLVWVALAFIQQNELASIGNDKPPESFTSPSCAVAVRDLNAEQAASSERCLILAPAPVSATLVARLFARRDNLIGWDELPSLIYAREIVTDSDHHRRAPSKIHESVFYELWGRFVRHQGVTSCYLWKEAGLLKVLKGFFGEISLPLCMASSLHSSGGGVLGLSNHSAGFVEGPTEQDSAKHDRTSRYERVKRHILSGPIDSLRSLIHPLLGDKVRYLALLAFPFAALAGFGGFIGFDQFDPDRRKRLFGRSLMAFASLFAAIFLLLGLL